MLYGVSQSNIDRLQRVQNVLARVVLQAPSTISSMDIRHELHWLPVYYRISYKLSLLTWKALHTAEPSYHSELISPYSPTRTLHSINTGLLVLPTGVTSHFASRSFSVSSPSVWNSLPAQSILSIISLHLSAILNHTFSSQLSLPSHPAPAPPIRSLRHWRSINLVVCMLSLIHI